MPPPFGMGNFQLRIASARQLATWSLPMAIAGGLDRRHVTRRADPPLHDDLARQPWRVLLLLLVAGERFGPMFPDRHANRAAGERAGDRGPLRHEPRSPDHRLHHVDQLQTLDECSRVEASEACICLFARLHLRDGDHLVAVRGAIRDSNAHD